MKSNWQEELLTGFVLATASYLYDAGIFGILAVLTTIFIVSASRTSARRMSALVFSGIRHNSTSTSLWCSSDHNRSLSIPQVQHEWFSQLYRVFFTINADNEVAR
jgi:hypothetical protein